MTKTDLQTLNGLQPIAQRMRERQEQLQTGKRTLHAGVADLLVLAQEQGKDILLAKTKLGSRLKWSEWLSAHVPNLDETEARKYERLCTEQLSDVRKVAFAFLPPSEKESTQPETPRTKAGPWETLYGFAQKMRRNARGLDLSKWPKAMKDATRNELEPICQQLFPERWT